jgi:hypothetical protein
MSAVFSLFWNVSFAGCGLPVLGAPRRVFAPAGRPTFFAGAKKVGKETPNTSLFERSGLDHLTRLRRVVRLGATSIHVHVKGLFFHHRWPTTTVIPAFAGMTNTGVQTRRKALPRRELPKTLPERQWPLAESSLHVCTPAPNHLSPNRLAFRCFLGDFFCTSKRSYSAAGPRPGAVYGVSVSNTQAIRLELNDVI